MSLIASVRTFLLTFDGLDDTAPFLTDVLGKEPVQYALSPIPGERILETYLNDKTLRQFPFALESMLSTADDVARIENSEFFERFSDWIEQQNAAGNLPTLDTGKTAETIEVLGHPSIIDFGESGTSIYQIQCRLTYEQVAP